jgi:hypothetical protein
LLEIFCRNLLSSGLDFELFFSPQKTSREEASTKVRCARVTLVWQKMIAMESEKEHIQTSNNDPRLSADFPGLRGISRVIVAL